MWLFSGVERENIATGTFLHLCVGALGKLGFAQKNGGGINVSLYDIAGFGVVMLHGVDGVICAAFCHILIGGTSHFVQHSGEAGGICIVRDEASAAVMEKIHDVGIAVHVVSFLTS